MSLSRCSRHSGTQTTEAPMAPQHFSHLKSTWAHNHSSTQGTQGTWRARGHSGTKGTWELGHLRHLRNSGTWRTLGHSRHLGTWGTRAFEGQFEGTRGYFEDTSRELEHSKGPWRLEHSGTWAFIHSRHLRHFI